MPIDDGSGEYIPPKRQYLDNLLINDPELGQVELWKSIAWNGAKLRKAMARADSADAVDEGAQGEGPERQPPRLVADAVVKEAEASLMTRIKDSVDALARRMTRLECDERERRDAEALKLAEDLAEIAPKELLSVLPDRITARLH